MAITYVMENKGMTSLVFASNSTCLDREVEWVTYKHRKYNNQKKYFIEVSACISNLQAPHLNRFQYNQGHKMLGYLT